ncbi:ABC-2 transporter permease [Glaciihabitans sp. UYNi722]|uniref:ABC-2 transporter permease n=1 Tax=Glaciihabitans sp. UYNi722 TaxID=3156344 RepID=UPI00339B4643
MLVVATLTPWPEVGIIAAAMIMSFLAPNPFAADERGHLDTLYATLPITRRVVVGRYLALVALYLAVAVVATIAVVVIPLTKGTAIDFAAFVPVNVAGFVIFAVALAVQLPLFFIVGYTRARPLIYIPIVAFVLVAWLVSQAGILDHGAFGSAGGSLPSGWILGLLVVIAVAALVASAVISSARYGRRDL